MKTIDDLKSLYSTIVELVENNDHELGETYWDEDEYGDVSCPSYAENGVSYEKDGWSIEVTYQCCGEWDNDPGDYWAPPCHDLIRAWGEVTDITAYHYDDDTDEETEFSEVDLKELRDMINGVLEDIA